VIFHSLPVLSLLIWLPIACGMPLTLLRRPAAVRRSALLIAATELLLAVTVMFHSDFSQPGFLWPERHPWIAPLNLHYQLGIDGISAPFLPFTALLGLLAVLASWHTVGRLHGLYFALLLALQGFTVGVFCALDLGLFFLFWELTLPPTFLLVALWGIGPQRRHAAVKYTLIMLGGGTLLLLGFSLLALNHSDHSGVIGLAGLSFDFPELLETPVPTRLQGIIFLLLLFGFATKAPLFPFHVWLPIVALEGPIAVTALLSGLKLGLYGILRFAIPLAPQAAQSHYRILAALGITGAVYGALLAMRQGNLRGMLAYSSVSHVGLVLLGISTFELQGVQGAVLQLLNFSVATGGAFLLAGFLQARFGSTHLAHLGGCARQLPLLASFLFLAGLAGMGVPGTGGFAAEHLILLGTFHRHAGLGLAALAAAILGAAAFLTFFRKTMLGPVGHSPRTGFCDLRRRELAIAVLAVLPILGFGLLPQPLLDISRKPLSAWLARLQPSDSGSLAVRGSLREAPVR